MDIHKPKAAHSWREFLIEIGTIICGIVIALGLEQLVEWVHAQSEVKEAREAIHREMEASLNDTKGHVDLAPCVQKRIRELEAWADSYRSGSKLVPTGRIGRMVNFIPQTQVWATLRSTPGVVHMPLEERLGIAAFYATVQIIQSFDEIDRSTWLQLQEFNGAPVLDNHAQMRLRGLAENARQVDDTLTILRRQLVERAHAVGVEALPYNFDARTFPPARQLCEPLIGGREHKQGH